MNNVKLSKFRVHILIKSVFAWKKMILLHFHLIIQVIFAECSLLTCKPSYLKQNGRWGWGGKAFFGKETAALRLLMHLNPEQKMKSLWAGAKQYSDFPLILGSSWTACPARSRSHILHFALALHPFYTHAVSRQSSPRLAKEKQPSLLLLFITLIVAQGLCYCCWHWTSCLQSQQAHFFFWLCFWA